MDPSEGRFDVCNGSAVYADSWHQEKFTSTIPSLAEIYQPIPTRQESLNGYVVSLSRIDRFFVSANPMDLLHLLIVSNNLHSINADQSIPEDERLASIRQIQRRQDEWALSRRKVQLEAIVDANGVEFASDEEAGATLREH